jgi:hypothetical protein
MLAIRRVAYAVKGSERMRRAFFLLTLVASTFLASARPAHAADEAASDPTSSRAIGLDASTGLAAIKTSAPGNSLPASYFFGVAPSYRVSRAVSLGASISYVHPVGIGVQLWSFAGEARYHFARTRTFDASVGGEIGFALSRLAAYACGDCGSDPAAATNMHVDPLAAASLTFEWSPVPYMSIGFVTRGMLVLFGPAIPGEDVLPSGASGALFHGLVIGAHVPVGG